jgi:DHA2 family multidrug resistance protein
VQASWIAYLDDFKLLMLLSIGVMPLLLIFRTPKTQTGTHT